MDNVTTATILINYHDLVTQDLHMFKTTKHNGKPTAFLAHVMTSSKSIQVQLFLHEVIVKFEGGHSLSTNV